jgi:hypothetical protein
MDLTALAQQATNILLPALPFIYAGKDVVTDKVKDMLLEKGIEKLGAKSIDRAKALFDKIRSKESESIEKAFNELSQNPEDLNAKNELQQEILKVLTKNPDLAKEIELTINFDVENINQFAMGDHNTLINFDNSSKQKFKNCKFEGNVFGNNSNYTDNSKHTHVSGNYCTYEGWKENKIFSNLILEKLAPLLISHFGKSKSMLLGFSIAIVGSLIGNFSIINDSDSHLQFLKLFFSLFLASIGCIMFLSIVTNDSTKCKTCGRGFAYKEVKRPLIEETYCSEGIIKKTIRYYRCQYCNDENVLLIEELIKPVNKSR